MDKPKRSLRPGDSVRVGIAGTIGATIAQLTDGIEETDSELARHALTVFILIVLLWLIISLGTAWWASRGS